MKIKVCGNKYLENALAIAGLDVDYMGFIFFAKSKRNVEANFSAKIAKQIKKAGVFVNETKEIVSEKIKAFDLSTVQLHGDESPEYCGYFKAQGLEVVKVFSVGEAFDFFQLEAYLEVCDSFLFDTKGKERGGNGVVFNWELLKDYPYDKPIIISGGIGLEELDALVALQATKLPIYAVDINSKFETEPAVKDIEKVKEFIKSIRA